MPPYTTQFGLTQDLADYLNRGLPSITGIFPTSTTTTTSNQGAKAAEAATAPLIAAAMQASNRGDGGFNPYNPDMNRVRTDYSPYAYRQAMAKSGVGIPSGILSMQKRPGSPSEFLYGPESKLEGLVNFIPGIGGLKRGAEFIGGILDPYLPVNQRAIMENEARGMGILTDDIGRIVQGSGDYNTGANVMAGYNLSQVTPETIQKRRDMINEKMKDPEQKAARLKALDEFEEMMFGPVGLTSRTDAIADEKLREKGLTPLTDQMAMNQAKLDFQKLANTEGIMGIDTSDSDSEYQEFFNKVTGTNYPGANLPKNIYSSMYTGVGTGSTNVPNPFQSRMTPKNEIISKPTPPKQNIPATPNFDVSGGAGGSYDRGKDYSGASDRTAGDRARTRDARKSDLGFSDIRLKENVELIGKSPSNINIYKFNYKDNPTTYQGVMAHEVPWANVKHNNGYMMVDYNKVDVKFKKWQK
tara:strand:- start:212 stop:1621 length:1410 start_codon:yes stop_codon:yes gene_type:complete